MDSMTGFGRGEAEKNGIKITAEIKSVNHRYFDISNRMPKQLSQFEDKLRFALKERFSRGHFDISVYMTYTESIKNKITINSELVKSYVSAAKQISKETGIRSKLSMRALLTLPDVMTIEKEEADEKLLCEILLEAIVKACDGVKAARNSEGQKLIEDMTARIHTLEKIVSQIESREPIILNAYREKIKARLESFLTDSSIDPIRFNQEILYFTDKSNITEECVRLKSHFSRMLSAFENNSENGRSLDFLIQEMNREFNTIGSKSTDLEISDMIVNAKAEVEKIREQIQNIE